MSAYDLDLHAWAHTQADALRRRSANEVDWENVAEEIESLGKQQYAELRNRLRVLLNHLLKWAYQPERQSRSWRGTIRIQRFDIAKHLRDNPSLKPVQTEAFVDAYQGARLDASNETELDEEVFPEEAPFSLTEALDDTFWPAHSATGDAPSP